MVLARKSFGARFWFGRMTGGMRARLMAYCSSESGGKWFCPWAKLIQLLWGPGGPVGGQIDCSGLRVSIAQKR